MFAEKVLRSTGRSRRGRDRLVLILCLLAGAISILPLGLVLFYLLVEGLKAWSPAFLVSPPGGGITTTGGGAANAIVGTLVMTGLGLLIATPTGLAVALYTAEYREGRLAVIVRTAVDLVAGIPSIVIGLFVYSVVVLTMGHFSGLAGAIALSLIMLPIIARTSEEMFKIVPRRMREGTMALAMPRWRAITSVYIPTVAGGIMTGIVLAVSRAVGRDGAAALHLPGQQLRGHRPQPPDVGAAALHVPERAEHRLPGGAGARLGGRADPGRHRAHLQRARALAGEPHRPAG